MEDWRNVQNGPAYKGPTDKTILNHITMFGTRKACTYQELFNQLSGSHNSERFHKILDRMIRDGVLECYIDKWQIFIKPVSFEVMASIFVNLPGW